MAVQKREKPRWHDLGLRIGVQPGGGVDDEATGFQGVLADVDLKSARRNVARKRAGYIAERICSPSAIKA
jgi:hypothetical protein